MISRDETNARGQWEAPSNYGAKVVHFSFGEQREITGKNYLDMETDRAPQFQIKASKFQLRIGSQGLMVSCLNSLGLGLPTDINVVWGDGPST